MHKSLFLILLICLTGAINAQKTYSLADTLTLTTITGKEIEFYSVNKLQVVIFLSTDCPLSQKYTLTLNQLSERFASTVSFYGVFPDTTSPLKTFSKFQEKYAIPFELIMDKQRILTSMLKAQITPECFVLLQGKILYHGAIDDWVIALGKTKSEPKINYLQNAITAVLEKTTPVLNYVKPIGCFID